MSLSSKKIFQIFPQNNITIKPKHCSHKAFHDLGLGYISRGGKKKKKLFSHAKWLPVSNLSLNYCSLCLEYPFPNSLPNKLVLLTFSYNILLKSSSLGSFLWFLPHLTSILSPQHSSYLSAYLSPLQPHCAHFEVWGHIFHPVLPTPATLPGI